MVRTKVTNKTGQKASKTGGKELCSPSSIQQKSNTSQSSLNNFQSNSHTILYNSMNQAPTINQLIQDNTSVEKKDTISINTCPIHYQQNKQKGARLCTEQNCSTHHAIVKNNLPFWNKNLTKSLTKIPHPITGKVPNNRNNDSKVWTSMMVRL